MLAHAGAGGFGDAGAAPGNEAHRPGWPERTSDVLWHVTRTDMGGEPWCVGMEFQADPDPLMFGRLLVYLGLAWLQLKPTRHPGDRFGLLPVIVNLRGKGETGRRYDWGEGKGVALEPFQWNVGAERADGILSAVGRGEAPRVLLAWIPLMQGGADPGIIARWLALAESEPGPRRPVDLMLVRVFAELAGCLDAWVKAMEGLKMRSIVVEGWKDEGRVEGRFEDRTQAIREFLEARFGGLPEDLAGKLGEQRPMEKLREWTALAARAGSLDDFRKQAGV